MKKSNYSKKITIIAFYFLINREQYKNDKIFNKIVIITRDFVNTKFIIFVEVKLWLNGEIFI